MVESVRDHWQDGVDLISSHLHQRFHVAGATLAKNQDFSTRVMIGFDVIPLLRSGTLAPDGSSNERPATTAIFVEAWHCERLERTDQ